MGRRRMRSGRQLPYRDPDQEYPLYKMWMCELVRRNSVSFCRALPRNGIPEGHKWIARFSELH